MEGNQSIDTHEMDLVEEFRALDEMEDPVDDATGRLDAFGGGEHLLALEASIGDDLSGILAFDGEDDEDEEDIDLSDDEVRDREMDGIEIQSPVDPAEPSALMSPFQVPKCAVREVVGNASGGCRTMAIDQDAAKGKGCDSNDQEYGTIRRGGVVSCGSRPEFITSSGNNRREAGGGRESGSNSSPDMLSPVRPTETSPDLDHPEGHVRHHLGDGVTDERPSSVIRDGDAESRDSRTSPVLYPFPSPSSQHIRSPLPAITKDGVMGCTNEILCRRENTNLEVGSSPTALVQQFENSSKAGKRSMLQCEVADSPPSAKVEVPKTQVPKTVPRGIDERNSFSGKDGEQCVMSGTENNDCLRSVSSTASRKVLASTADGTEVGIIKNLQTELSLLKEHVLRCEQKRESQLRELQARLEAQEHRNRSISDKDSSEERVSRGVEEDTSSGAPDTTCAPDVAHANNENTPRGPATVNNPFAAQIGGTDTPRDHFPAFEDALHDARTGNGTSGEGDGDKSRQSEAFDFSIDTLSHINNHTDFGTEAPVTAAAAAATLGASNCGDRRGATRGKCDSMDVDGAWSSGKPLPGNFERDSDLRQEAEEAFDPQDRAAEEAFFADACATAILQTPIKHVLATGGGAVDGVVVRKTRQGDLSRKIPGERPRQNRLAASGHRTQRRVMDNSPRNSPPHRGNAGSHDGDSDGLGNQELCMADFFARAAKQLGETSSDKRSGELPSGEKYDEGAPVLSEKAKVVRVDVATQTTWSFSAHHGVRFVSTPIRTPLRMMEMMKQDAEEGAEDSANWALRYPFKRSPSFASPDAHEGAVPTHETCIPGSHRHPEEDEGSFRTPLVSRPRASRLPRDTTVDDCDEASRAGASGLSDASTFFQSPGLSPIVDMRPCPNHYRSRNEEYDNMRIRDNVQGDGHRVDGGDPPRSQLRRGRQRSSSALSPIRSDRDDAVAGSSDSSPGNIATVRQAPRMDRSKARTEPSGRSSVVDSGMPESSMDASARSSLFIASTTLESMAPLDGTTQSFASYLRGGSSFAGELFVDEKLRESCTGRPLRQGKPSESCEHRPVKGKWLLAPPPPRPPIGRRPRSPPTLPPGEAVADARSTREIVSASSMRGTGIPPAMVGAWLAAAIEGFRGHSAGNERDARDLPQASMIQGVAESAPSFSGPLDLDAALAKSSLPDIQRRRANPAALLKEASEMGIRDRDAQFDYVSALGKPRYLMQRRESPPPPPPPSPPLRPGRLQEYYDDNRVESMSEEELFYQRQRLIHRAASAAASHGGVIQLPVRGSAAMFDVPVETIGTRGVDWRRHSDPLLWKPSPAPTVTEGAVASVAHSGATGSGCAASGTSLYLRRHTSGYWRDKLGMTL